MIVILEERDSVVQGYASMFDREGVPATGFGPDEFGSWIESASEADFGAVEGFLLGDYPGRPAIPRAIKVKSRAAVIAMNEHKSLGETLDLFAAGVDDVVRKPIHVREILARIKAIRSRASVQTHSGSQVVSGIRVFSDGRDPEVGGEVLPLPRRERRILEYLFQHRGCRVTKTQIFNSVYGLFSDDIDENVVETHISKLRKRLKHRLGRDVIDSQRYLGYRLICD